MSTQDRLLFCAVCLLGLVILELRIQWNGSSSSVGGTNTQTVTVYVCGQTDGTCCCGVRTRPVRPPRPPDH